MGNGGRKERRAATLWERGPDGGAEPELDGARRMALDGLARAFEAAEAGRDWFAMKAELKRVDDAVQAVWYAARVRDDGSR
ncbi:MAG: hypothetical protein F4X36_05545 [Gammaproteobacteria bacterium]|nr:hypothetical protein [Gammaproteobacteria bacterium]